MTDMPPPEADNNALIPAATLVLLRERAPSAFDVFMVQRHHKIRFAGGALVFPGGKLAQGDHHMPATLLPTSSLVDETILPFMVAAIRECFEECGVLLAYDSTSGTMIDAARTEALAHFRPVLDADEISLADFLEDQKLILATDQLVHFAHWVSSEMLPRRFDTHFFIARMPYSQKAIHDGREAVDSLWAPPAQILQAFEDGQHKIIFPTRRNLERLNRSDDIEAVFADARATPIIKIIPWMEERSEGNFLCLPKDAGYEVTEEPFLQAMK